MPRVTRGEIKSQAADKNRKHAPIRTAYNDAADCGRTGRLQPEYYDIPVKRKMAYGTVSVDRFQDDGEEEASTRLKDRGIARKRRAKRNRRVAFSVLAILAIGFWLLFAFAFKIEVIAFSGISIYDEPVLRSAFGYNEGDHLFSFRKDRAAQAMLDVLPYLETVKISRMIPGNVLVEVTPSVEYYCIRQENTNLITTSSFKALRTGDATPGLLTLSGLNISPWTEGQTVTIPDEEQGFSVETVLETIEQSPVEGLTEIDFTDIYEMKLICNTGINIAIGTYAGLDYKLLLATQSIAKLPEGSVGLMDVSGAYTGHKAYFTAGAT